MLTRKVESRRRGANPLGSMLEEGGAAMSRLPTFDMNDSSASTEFWEEIDHSLPAHQAVCSCVAPLATVANAAKLTDWI